jgi:glutamate-1-semialdehyde 2,1-aminomutase
MAYSRAKQDREQQRATRVMPRGVNSNVRYWGEGKSLYIERAKGATVWDLDGNRYIDYRLAFGPIILGYAFEPVDQKVMEAVQQGICVGFTTLLEIEAAERIASICPASEMVRMVNSGTEAGLHAIRLARAYTGREKIVKFEGMYHGSNDQLLYSTIIPANATGWRGNPVAVAASTGLARALEGLVITLPFNDEQVLEDTMRQLGNEVAAVITEPMLGNLGAVDAQPGFLEFVLEQCERHGALMILDEVKTGFRIGRGGAQEVLGLRPHLTLYAKALGNGYPVAALGGQHKVMDLLGRGVSQGGTYCGNAVAAAAAVATLEVMEKYPVHEHINSLGRQLQVGLGELFAAAGLPAMITRYPAIFSFALGIDTPVDGRSWAFSEQGLYRRLAAAALRRGVLIDQEPREPLCLCYSHTEADIALTLAVMQEALAEAIGQTD